VDAVASVDSLDALLPQTQCTRCGYPSCREYAAAIATGEAAINQCPPGGTETILALSALTGRRIEPLNKDNGIESAPMVAFIDEERCIGCTKCLPPCPVDAIVGARQLMHTVVAELCTGCELCVAPCPVDCITMIPLLASPLPSLTLPDADDSRRRFQARNARVMRRADEKAATLAAKKLGARLPTGSPTGSSA
jgi:electron transport complex protein RnfB